MNLVRKVDNIAVDLSFFIALRLLEKMVVGMHLHIGQRLLA